MTAPIVHARLPTRDGPVRHGFLGRKGGVSSGLYRSLNCGLGSHDAPDAVRENRARAVSACGLAPEALCTVYQIHSARAVHVEGPWPSDAPPRADAMASATPGVVLGILTADCAPVLLADPEARVIGAVHAGWRGALDGVLEAGVEAMQRLGARSERIAAVVGPCIAQASYEVGPEFPEPFVARRAADDDLFIPARREGHHLFDLAGYVVRRLSGLGLDAVAATGHDTCGEVDRFFSYRRSCHQNEPDYGRNLSVIGLAA